jgi:hypothetical protein
VRERKIEREERERREREKEEREDRTLLFFDYYYFPVPCLTAPASLLQAPRACGPYVAHHGHAYVLLQQNERRRELDLGLEGGLYDCTPLYGKRGHSPQQVCRCNMRKGKRSIQ